MDRPEDDELIILTYTERDYLIEKFQAFIKLFNEDKETERKCYEKRLRMENHEDPEWNVANWEWRMRNELKGIIESLDTNFHPSVREAIAGLSCVEHLSTSIERSFSDLCKATEETREIGTTLFG